MDSNATPRKRLSVVFQELESGEKLLYDMKARRTFRLNETGVFFWSRCDGTTSVRDITKDVASEAEVPGEVVLRDALEFFEKLQHLGLLEL